MILNLALAIGVASTQPVGLIAFLGGQQGQLLVYGVIMIGFFYFGIMRPQQRRAKEHAARVSSVKRGDTVVLNSGVLGKVVRVEEAEIGLEIAQNVTVKVVKSMISEVRARGEPAPANDPKS